MDNVTRLPFAVNRYPSKNIYLISIYEEIYRHRACV
jgi:hypothetical protein